MKIVLVLLVLFFFMAGVHAETAQYYNESSGQMEIPIVTGNNRVGFCSLENSNLTAAFAGLPPADGDIVRRYVDGNDHSAKFFAGYGWYEYETVNPIEAGVGYKYERQGGNCTWTYDTEFYCEDCGGDGAAIVETVYVSPDYEDVALLFYIFIVPILYLFIVFKKRVNTVGLSMIFLIFAFFVLLFQVITISVNIIYLIIFLFLFMTSIAGITKQGAD